MLYASRTRLIISFINQSLSTFVLLLYQHNTIVKTINITLFIILLLLAKLLYNSKGPYVHPIRFGISWLLQKIDDWNFLSTFQLIWSKIKYKTSIAVGLLIGSFLATFMFFTNFPYLWCFWCDFMWIIISVIIQNINIMKIKNTRERFRDLFYFATYRCCYPCWCISMS